jgi:4-amino-4-deoxy-L-arabinose transferase-like glycosyltransferase
VILLAGTAVLYLWSLSASGYANSFYSAAVQAGSQSWKAFLFGSLDAGNAITVDKPPASLWLMALSVRIFGLSSWSILVPQALLGVATVGVLYASVRRTVGSQGAGLLAGALLALTPVAALMFRFNNPDALLVFLLTAAAYATLRASERASGKWLVGAGVLVGFAFLTKMLQAFLVLPAFVLVYLIVAPTSVGRRVKHLLFALAAMIISLGWWVALVELVPETWRPYIGGSQTNSVLDLVFGYNGLARILGNDTGIGGGGGFGGEASITRLFETVSGGMITWLIPAALLLAAVAMIIIRRAPRTDGVRAAIMIWGGWLLVTGLVFSFMAGIYHEYYTVALAPAIAALVAIGGQVLWQQRMHRPARIGLAATMIITAGWAFLLLERAPAAYQILQGLVLIVGLVAAAGLLFVHRLPRAVAWVVVGLAMVGGTTGPAAYTLQTVTTPHTGSIVTAGPVAGSGLGRGPAGTGPTIRPDGGGGVVSTAVVELLTSDADSYRWVAATTGSQGAAGFQLATGRPVMAIGGFGGGDPSPTLDQFQAYVAEGQIHYYLSGGNRGGGGGPGGNDGSAAQIATWVAANFTAITVDGVTLYDLTAAR